GRGGAADPAGADEPRRGDRLYRRRRARRGDTGRDPPAQAAPRHQRSTSRQSRRGGGVAIGEDAVAARAIVSIRNSASASVPSHHSCQTPYAAKSGASVAARPPPAAATQRRGAASLSSRSQNQPSSSANNTAPGMPSSSQT